RRPGADVEQEGMQVPHAALKLLIRPLETGMANEGREELRMPRATAEIRPVLGVEHESVRLVLCRVVDLERHRVYGSGDEALPSPHQTFAGREPRQVGPPRAIEVDVLLDPPDLPQRLAQHVGVPIPRRRKAFGAPETPQPAHGGDAPIVWIAHYN